jgi:gliding motility-associated-like protein
MQWKTHILIVGSLLFWGSLFAQVSPDCSSAIPICSNTPISGGVQGYGQNDFGPIEESGCLEQTLSGYIESNSAWYRFRTGASGQLGFNIGFDPSEDWDFALYRASDCGALGEPVRCNFYDNRDQEVFMGVGEDPTGNANTYLYEPWLEVSEGEDYVLLINNFSNSNSGFSIQFSGEIFIEHPYDALDCSIVDNLLGPPVAACEGDPVLLDATTTGASLYEWYMDTGSGFEQIPGESGPTYLADEPALYRVRVNLACCPEIISEVQVAFSPAATAYEITDRNLCAEIGFELHSLDAEALGVQSPDEFLVSYHLNPEEAAGGIHPLPSDWNPANGAGTVYYRVTSLQNPQCFDASRSFEYSLVTPPQLDLPEQAFICGGVSQPLLGPLIPEQGVTYSWSTGENTPRITVSEPGLYTLTAVRNEGGVLCEVSDSVEVIASAPPGIGQILIEDLQVSNTVTVEPLQEGIFEYALNDGPFQSSPVFTDVPAGNHTLHMRDALGCGSLTEVITVVGFDTFFTPNGDGLHDFWSINGLTELTDPEVFIFDRYGKLLKQLDETSAGWDGTFNGSPLPATDYWFRLNYTDDTGQRVTARYLKAHFALKR